MKKLLLLFGVVLLSSLMFYALQPQAATSSAPIALAQDKLQQKGMGEMKMMENKELDKIRKDLDAAKRKLAKEGHYSCCNAPTCDECAIAMNMCPCGDNIKKGDAVCGQCAGGWSAGFGDVEGIDPSKVKAMSGDMLKMAYGMRAKMYGAKMKEMKK